MSQIKVMITADEIKEKVTRLGDIVSNDYAGRKLLLLAVLNGSFIFAADLMRSITHENVEIRFVRAKSYCGTQSSGTVSVVQPEEIDFSDRDVLIVEDIIDTGNTLKMLKHKILDENPESVKIAAFLDKPSRRVVDLQPDYFCFQIPDKFVVGYGLDYDEKYRQLPFVGEIID